MYKLMIAEDEPLERLSLRKIIEKQYFNIDVVKDAKNGTEAIQNAKAYHPNIILMDIRMPEANGLEAQKRIIKIIPNVRTIILSAYDEFDYAREAIKYGVIEYLLKPVKTEDLVKSIDSVIEVLKKDKAAEVQDETGGMAGEDTLKKILFFVEKNFCSDLKLNAVAEYVHLNPQYLSRYFKKEMGITLIEYVNTLRIEKAKKMLLETNYPIYRIASELGFSDPSYFNKVFIKYEKKSPIKYKHEV